MKSKIFTGLFLLLYFVVLPFPYWTFNLLEGLFYPIYSRFLKYVAELLQLNYSSQFLSDGVLQYLSLALIFVLSIILFYFLIKLRVEPSKLEKTLTFLYKINLLILSFFMVKYGLDKLIGGQFNIVEGNLLHKELKHFSKDLLLWATLQSSELFNYVTGGVEIIGGLFILNTYTRKLGLLVCTTSLLFVVLLNFSFDINVKILSLYLLAQSIYAWGPYYKNLQNLLLPRTEIIVLDKEASPHQLNKWVISFFLLFLISEGVIQHLSSTKDRPEWAKSYEVIGENNYFIHIHSDAFIIEEKDGVFESNAFQVLNATPTNFRFKTADVVQLILSDSTSIYWVKNQNTLEIEVIDFSHTSYLQDDFHWTTEGSLGVK